MSQLSINQFDRDVIRAIVRANKSGTFGPIIAEIVLDFCEVCERDQFYESIIKLCEADIVERSEYGRICLTLDGIKLYNQIDQSSRTINK